MLLHGVYFVVYGHVIVVLGQVGYYWLFLCGVMIFLFFMFRASSFLGIFIPPALYVLLWGSGSSL